MLPVPQGCLETFSKTLSAILEGQGVSLPDLLTCARGLCPLWFIGLPLLLFPSKELIETMQSVKTKLQTFVKE